MDKQPNNTSDSPKTDNKKTSSSPETTKPKDVKTSRHATRYLIVGISLTVFNYILYTILANLVINNNDYLWLSTFISTTFTTILAYILHSKITWKERTVTKTAIYKFFIWNALLTIAIGPWLTQLFSFITPLYDLASNISQAINLPFTYEFIQSTGAFILTSLIVMILNFLFYDRFIFGKTKV